MNANIGSADRLIRIVLGLILVLLPFVASAGSIVSYGAPIVGAVLIITALFRFCPAYRLLGIRTCKA